MNKFQEIYDLTLIISDILKNTGNKDRDHLIEEVTSLINKRQVMLDQLQPSYSDQEKLLGTKIAELDQENNKLLKMVLNEIKRDLTNLKKRKSTQNRYENSYARVYNDGVFLDKRN
ncbi:hypothetical protein [Bacillus dakarensis]|uniref:hypothetical protein n=1 Tax=Robertmurraya dakarensis TaxID=1926278 RepID=UPI000980D85C|nr:hypothetical protein [Bacillus dakarensis]